MNEFGSEKLKAFFINIDEFLLFKEILEHIKLYDINIFNMLVENLAQNKKMYLLNLKDYKKVNVKNNVKIRKFVKVKRTGKK